MAMLADVVLRSDGIVVMCTLVLLPDTCALHVSVSSRLPFRETPSTRAIVKHGSMVARKCRLAIMMLVAASIEIQEQSYKLYQFIIDIRYAKQGRAIAIPLGTFTSHLLMPLCNC